VTKKEVPGMYPTVPGVLRGVRVHPEARDPVPNRKSSVGRLPEFVERPLASAARLPHIAYGLSCFVVRFSFI
jgi:hypothetical protein